MNKDLQYIIKYMFRFLSDEQYLHIAYYLKFKKKLNLSNPKTLNEKIQWIKLNDRNDIYSILVDKYKVKQYIADIIGEEYVIPTYGVWNSFSDIDFEMLPHKFVLKCNHDSGGIVICKDKQSFDIVKAKRLLQKHIRRNYFWHGREWAYKNVQPLIIAEKMLETNDCSDLQDFKFFCFSGKVKIFKVDCDRFHNHKAYYFNEKGELLHFSERVFKPETWEEFPDIPLNINKMIQLAEIIAANLSFARIDFYNINGKVFFGEITLYPASGMDVFDPPEWDEKLGDMLELRG